MTAKEIKIGTPVTYWSVIKSNGQRFYPHEGVIESEPWQLPNGLFLCKISGKSGGVLINHLEKRQTQTTGGDE